MARTQRRTSDGRYARGPALAPTQRSEELLATLRARSAAEPNSAPYTWAANEVRKVEEAMRRTWNPLTLAARQIERRHLENRYGPIDWRS